MIFWNSHRTPAFTPFFSKTKSKEWPMYTRRVVCSLFGCRYPQRPRFSKGKHHPSSPGHDPAIHLSLVVGSISQNGSNNICRPNAFEYGPKCRETAKSELAAHCNRWSLNGRQCFWSGILHGREPPNIGQFEMVNQFILSDSLRTPEIDFTQLIT